MSIPETALIFVGIPFGLIALAFIAVFLPSEMKSPGRYRPGRPWEHEPSWYLPHQLTDAPTRELDAHAPAAILAAPVAHDTVPTGGASGEW